MPPRIVPLAAGDIEALLALSASAHWNQTRADWGTMLELGRGWGIRDVDSAGSARLVASTLILPYENRFAWVSMVLVLPAWRGRGLARRLLATALEELARRRLTPVLDATPAGHAVYLKQGFVDSWGFARWRRAAPVAAQSGPRRLARGVRALQAQDWLAVAALDAPAFGADRLALLQRLARALPQAAWVLERDGVLQGYLLGRPGRTALQLGPLLAADAGVAIDLLDTALHALRASEPERSPGAGAAAGRHGSEFVADLREACPEVRAWLEQLGFVCERPFTRMVHGGAAAPGSARGIVLVAGPELG